MYGLEGRKAIVTGAAQGIGRAIAARLLDEGCHVGILDLDGEGVERAAGELGRGSGGCFADAVDVADPTSVGRVLPAMAERLGGVDILVNNAGILKLASVQEADLAGWRQIFSVNVEGMLLCSQALLPGMIENGRGRIVNLASWMGKQGVENYGAYCASKAAAISLTQTLALEVAPRGIHVNAVCPGVIVETRMRAESDEERLAKGMSKADERASSIPLRRVGRPQDVARIVAFLVSEEATYMTGQAINVTGGMWMN
ncbi:SDR family NAD(P)-dependent oxidoreductase [uncultured Roseovarius sp.]|uniref:SDR family NAD(P)-dependent oxidoreductase n=1 Tax=uncultured Roseovarius sp. TaxID=293344 RepID=UPI00262EC1A4|nr:SDR family NAD(P)-dependent oxidoreductase [uncultured Roseovarius sp.]